MKIISITDFTEHTIIKYLPAPNVLANENKVGGLRKKVVESNPEASCLACSSGLQKKPLSCPALLLSSQMKTGVFL